MTKFEKACMLVKQAHNKVALVKDITVYGYQFNYETTIIGTVNKYWFGNNQIIEKIAPLDKDSGNHNRSGDKKKLLNML